jgi:hypothetical protein
MEKANESNEVRIIFGTLEAPLEQNGAEVCCPE